MKTTGLIDTSAVIDAIDSGIVGALALDVYEHEASLFFEDLSEIPFERRRHLVDRGLQLLMSYPNVLVTPHSEREREKERESEEISLALWFWARGRESESENGKHNENKTHPIFPRLSLKQLKKTVAFATNEALEEIARVVQKNITAWWEWKRAGADASVVLENEVVATKK